jgi:class 3 adenylate cyclase
MMADENTGRALTGDLQAWLSGIGLGGHAASFTANGIDWDILVELTEADIRELGLSLGDRKRLMKAIGALNEGQPRGAEIVPLRPVVREAPPSEVSAERRSLTVMFVDLVGSTPLSEQLDPEDMREVLRAFHEGCATAIGAEEGHIARYMGDGILVYFGYPQAHEDDAARAVRAGLGIIKSLELTNRTLDERYGVRLQARIGIHTGLVVVGEVGAGSARDRDAIVGDTPNIAARLQGEAQSDTVVVSAATRRLIEGLFVFEDVGSRALKGVSALIRLSRVVAPVESHDRFDTRAERGLTPLVGRSAELDMLGQRWQQARDGEMRCLLLVGEAGIGKSRVVRAFRDSLAEEPYQTVSWHCSSYHRNSAFFPVIVWLCRSLGIDQQDPVEALPKVRDAASGLGLFGPELHAALSSLIAPAAEEAESSDTTGLAFKRKLLDALSAMIDAMARRQPLFLVVEDAHWADPSTLDLLRELQERLQAARLLVLVTARPEFRAGWNYPQFVQVNLDRLSRRDRQAMIERLTDGKALPDFVLEQIVARTDGVPLFVEELTKTVLEGNTWRDAGTHYELEGPFQGIAIPDSLQGSLIARLDRLEPAAKEIAQIGAAIGREFDRELLGLVAPQASEALEAGLDQLVAAEIVRPVWLPAVRGKAYSFRHALIQDAAYQSLLLVRRRQYHAAIGEALLSSFSEIATAQPELIAHHLTVADQIEPAIDAWQRSAESALARGAYAESQAHVARGLDLIKRLSTDEQVRARRSVPFLLIRGQLEIKETRSQAQATFHEAASLARQTGLASEFAFAAIGMCRAEQYGYTESPMAKSFLEEALANPAVDDPILRCRVQARLGRALLLSGEVEQGAALTAEARSTAQRLGDPQCLMDTIGNELMVSPPPIAAGFDRQRRLIRQNWDFSNSNVDTFEAMYGAGLSAARFLEIGDIEGFREALAGVAELARTTQAASDRWLSLSFQAMSDILTGNYSTAEQKATEAFVAVNETTLGPYLGIYGTQMFAIRREQGRLAEVAPLVKRFVSENPKEAVWKPGLMLIASDLGFHAQARQHFESFAKSGFALPEDTKRLVTLSYFAEVCVVQRDAARAEDLYELLLPYRDVTAMVLPNTVCNGAASHYLGMLATIMADWSAAEGHFKAALALNERLKAWPRLAWTRFEYACMLLARDENGDTVFAEELRAKAVAAAERLGMGLLLRRDASLDAKG